MAPTRLLEFDREDDADLSVAVLVDEGVLDAQRQTGEHAQYGKFLHVGHRGVGLHGALEAPAAGLGLLQLEGHLEAVEEAVHLRLQGADGRLWRKGDADARVLALLEHTPLHASLAACDLQLLAEDLLVGLTLSTVPHAYG